MTSYTWKMAIAAMSELPVTQSARRKSMRRGAAVGLRTVAVEEEC